MNSDNEHLGNFPRWVDFVLKGIIVLLAVGMAICGLALSVDPSNRGWYCSYNNPFYGSLFEGAACTDFKASPTPY